MTAARIAPLRIVIAGGGVAALEALMALHDLGEAQFRLTLVAPRDDFVLRAMSVAVPFSAGHVAHVSLDEACAEFGAEHRHAGVAAVDADARRVRCTDGTELDYDVLVLATGAAGRPAYANALTFSDDDPLLIGGLLRDIEQGYCPSLALVVPPSGSWSLPVYELALLIARQRVRGGDRRRRCTSSPPSPRRWRSSAAGQRRRDRAPREGGHHGAHRLVRLRSSAAGASR